MVSSSYSADNVSLISSEQVSTAPTDPPRGGRWVYAAVVGGTFIFLQILLMIPVMMYLIATGQLEDAAALDNFLLSEDGLLIAIIMTAISGVATVMVAFAWPWVWNRILRGRHYPIGDWLAWRAPRRLKAWMVVGLTLPILVILGFIVTMTFGESGVDAQLMLFSSPLLQIVSSLVVVLVAPIAEEVVFRGALYNALLPANTRTENASGWQRHILPFVVVSVAFTALHLLAGFEKLGSLVLLLGFSMYLTWLRAFTGSIKTSVVGHMAWNGVAALALILQNIPGFQI